MRLSTKLLPLLSVLLAGCGGSSESNPAPLAANPYVGFGYADRLYQGTFTGRDGLGGFVEVPVTISVSEDERTVQAYGYRIGESASSVNVASVPGSSPFLGSRLSGNLQTLRVYQSGSRVVLVGKGDDGLEFRAEGSLETPDISPAVPPASGLYEGALIGRDGTTGGLSMIATVTGNVDADGRFEFRFHTGFGLGTAIAGSSGLARGRIAADGSVKEPVLALGGGVTQTDEVRALGTEKDLTVAFLYPGNFQELFFRAYRTGP